jgi:hypothetical protein
LIQPNIRQILIQVVARADLPAFQIRADRQDTIPPSDHQLVRTHGDSVLGEVSIDTHMLYRAFGGQF